MGLFLRNQRSPEPVKCARQHPVCDGFFLKSRFYDDRGTSNFWAIFFSGSGSASLTQKPSKCVFCCFFAKNIVFEYLEFALPVFSFQIKPRSVFERGIKSSSSQESCAKKIIKRTLCRIRWVSSSKTREN